jgi:hypothetical protein
MPVELIILEPFPFESRRLCVTPPVGARGGGAAEIFLLSGAQFRGGRAFPGGRRSSIQLTIVWSIMLPETERGMVSTKRSTERERRGELASRSQGPSGQRGFRKHPTYELPPLDGRLTRLLRCLCSDRRTKFPRLGRSESDMSMRTSERPRSVTSSNTEQCIE